MFIINLRYIIYTSIFLFITKKYIENNKSLHDQFINISFHMICFYTKCEFYYHKLFNYVKNTSQYKLLLPYINIWFNVNKPDFFNFEIIENGEIIQKLDLNDNSYNSEMICDFSIYSDYLTDTINKVLYYDNFTNYNSYVVCNYKFILINLHFNNKIYQIDLFKNGNYYIVGNKINKLFLKYFVKQNYNIDLTNVDYKLEIIDQNVNTTALTNLDEIVFNLDNYEIVPYKNICKTELSTYPDILIETFSRKISDNMCYQEENTTDILEIDNRKSYASMSSDGINGFVNIVNDNIINDNIINDNIVNDNIINDNIVNDNIINDNIVNDN